MTPKHRKKAKLHRAPQHLRAAMRSWWRSVNENFELDDHHRLLLTAACEALDRAEEARLTLLNEGSFFTDRHGARKVHPAVNVERDNRALFSRLLRELQLDTSADAPRPPALSGYGRREG
jgi:phage terminase small subunit